ncbi:hypothetical protein BC826DRAFT_966584 [Russula brevipes]|nr:hypothetical protein BC826DRAFT_966584 [Russula brevipes]
MYPFRICHTATHRCHTLYTQSATERNRWHSAFVSAVEERNSQKDWKKLYVVHTLNNGSFRVPSRLQLTYGVHDTGRVVSAAGFSFQEGRYIAVGCTSGIYVNKRGSGNSFKKVMEFNEPNSMVAIPEFNKFLVHCESALFSYPLDMVVRVSQGDATLKNLDDFGERLAQEYGDVTLLKAGSLDDRTLGSYLYNEDYQTGIIARARIDPPGWELKDPDCIVPAFGLCSSPRIVEKIEALITLMTARAYSRGSPRRNVLSGVPGSSPTVVPNFPNSKRDSEMLQLVPTKRKSDTTKILDLVRSANILGMVPHEKDILLIYDDLGCFVGKDGKPARSSYYVEWEVTATTYALRGSHLLLFSLGYIEVRNIDTGQLVSMVKTENDPIRLLRSGLIGRALLIAVMACAFCGGGGHTEKLVELVYHDPNVLDAQVAMVPAK